MAEVAYIDALDVVDRLEEIGKLNPGYFESMVPHRHNPGDYPLEIDMERKHDEDFGEEVFDYEIEFADGGKVEGKALQNTPLYEYLEALE